MDYRELFRPLLSYATHLRLALRSRRRVISTEKIHQDIAEILDRISVAKNTDPRYDAAWFPVACWLRELLLQERETRPLADSFDPPPTRSDSEFYFRLNSILRYENDNPRNLELLQIYLHCLELGYIGYYSRLGKSLEREEYLDCCRIRLRKNASRQRFREWVQ